MQTDDPDQQWKFEKETNLAYKLIHTEQKNAPVISQAHLFKLRDQIFLDLGQHSEAPDDNAFPPRLPSHLLVRIYELKPTLRAGTMNYQWIVALLDKDPTALRHHVIKKGEKIEDRELVLTAPTEELQQFIIKHLSTEAAWNDFELKRLADSPKSK